MTEIKATWLGGGGAPQAPSSPDYPKGVRVDVASNQMLRYEDAFPRVDGPTCCRELFYPAEEIGAWVIDCPVCGIRVALTAAGRPDDPRCVRLPCRLSGTS